MFKSILVPVDDSEPSAKALTFALDLASSQDASIQICHVSPSVADAEEAGRAVLDAAAYRAEEFGVVAKTDLCFGTPADAIIELADRDGIDVIVMSSHGYEGPIGTLFSNTSGTVFRRASVPVLIVGPNAVWEAMSSRTLSCA